MVVHGKVRWTSGRCMVAYGGHAPMTKWSEFEFEKWEPDFKFKQHSCGSQIFEIWRQILIQMLVGNGTCWEGSPMLAIDTKVYKRIGSLT